MIKLAYSIHSTLLLSTTSTTKISKSLKSLFHSLLSFWIEPFSNIDRNSSNNNLTKPTNRGDELALSLLSVWSNEERYIPWLETLTTFNWESNNFTSSLAQVFSTKLQGIPYILLQKQKSKSKSIENTSSTSTPKQDDHQSDANLTSRLIGSILEMDSSLSSRIISKVLCQLPADVLLPVCCSGPISR